MKKGNGVERKRDGLVMIRFLEMTHDGETETQKARGEKDPKQIPSGEEARRRRNGDEEKVGMKRGLTEEKMTDRGGWGMTKRESLLSDQMMIGFPDVAWMTTEVLDAVLRKIASLAVGQTMTGRPGEWVMKTGEAGATQMMTGLLDEDWMRTEAGGQLMRTEDQDEAWTRTGDRGAEVLMTSGRPGAVLTMTGDPGGAWMTTGAPGVGWMMTEEHGGMPMMTEFPGVVPTTTGGLGEIWMTIGSPDGLMTTGFPGGAMMQGLVSGGLSSSQVDGERKKKPEKRVGVHLANQDHRRNVNGTEKKRERIRIERRTIRTRRESETEREIGTGTEMEREMIASDGQGMKVIGEEDQPRNLRAGEIQVAVMIGMTVVVREMIAVI